MSIPPSASVCQNGNEIAELCHNSACREKIYQLPEWDSQRLLK